jgi:putative transposase
MPNYRRVWVPGGTYFFTVNLLERRRTLLIDHIDSLRHAFAQARAARPFLMPAYVVLPDHLHCLWRLPPGDDDIATRWRHIKTTFSRSLPKLERRSGTRRRKGERGIWQRRYWERVMRDEADYRCHFDYLHYNPVRHGHAATAADWPHSSFRHWVCRGVYPDDWAEP